MIISHYGEGAFRVQNGDLSLLVDPTNNRLQAQIILRTLTPANLIPPASGEISFPGEYEMHGIEITGVGVQSESTEKFLKTVYSVLWEDIRLVFLGHISKPLDESVLEEIGEPDVLVVPAAGGHFLAPEAAVRMVRQLEPSVVIPSFMKSPAEFLKALGQKAEAEDKFVFKKKDIADIRSRPVILKAI